jgi:hypothetical protein
MFASIRRYAPLPTATHEAFAARAVDIRHLLRSVPGAIDSALIQTHDGVALVIYTHDETSAVESGRRFVAWAISELPDLRRAPEPVVWAGIVLGTDMSGDRRQAGVAPAP